MTTRPPRPDPGTALSARTTRFTLLHHQRSLPASRAQLPGPTPSCHRRRQIGQRHAHRLLAPQRTRVDRWVLLLYFCTAGSSSWWLLADQPEYLFFLSFFFPPRQGLRGVGDPPPQLPRDEGTTSAARGETRAIGDPKTHGSAPLVAKTTLWACSLDHPTLASPGQGKVQSLGEKNANRLTRGVPFLRAGVAGVKKLDLILAIFVLEFGPPAGCVVSAGLLDQVSVMVVGL